MSNPSYTKLLQPTGLALETYLSGRDVIGPASYVQTANGGHVVSANLFGLGAVRMAFASSLSSSGTYFVRPQMKRGNGATTFKLVWYVAATGAEVGAGTALNQEFVPILVVGK